MVTRGCVVFKAFFALGVTCAGNWRDNAAFWLERDLKCTL